MAQAYNPLPYGSPPPVARGVGGFGIAALVLGLLALIMSWVPLCGIAAFPVAGVGIVMAIVGIILAKSNGRSTMTLSIAGGIICVVAIGIQMLVTGGLMFLGARSPQAQASRLAQPIAQSDNGFTLVSDPAFAGDVSRLLADESKKAAAQGRKPFVEFYADWCGPCRALAKSLDDPVMVDAFQGTYIIRLDGDRSGNKLDGTGMSTSTIPVFYELNGDGKSTGRSIDGGAWGANIPANMAPPLKKFFNGGPP